MPLFFWFNQFLDSRAEILETISLVFWKKLSFHKDIIKLTDLYPPSSGQLQTFYILSNLWSHDQTWTCLRSYGMTSNRNPGSSALSSTVLWDRFITEVRHPSSEADATAKPSSKHTYTHDEHYYSLCTLWIYWRVHHTWPKTQITLV